MVYVFCLMVSGLFVAGNLVCMNAAKVAEQQTGGSRAWILLALAAGLMACGIVGQYFCVKSFGALRATGIIDSLLTVTTLALAWYFFKEQLTPRQWMGLAAILAGIYLVK